MSKPDTAPADLHNWFTDGGNTYDDLDNLYNHDNDDWSDTDNSIAAMSAIHDWNYIDCCKHCGIHLSEYVATGAECNQEVAESEEPPELPKCTHSYNYNAGFVDKCPNCGEYRCAHAKVKLIPMIYSTIKICADCGVDLGNVTK